MTSIHHKLFGPLKQLWGTDVAHLIAIAGAVAILLAPWLLEPDLAVVSPTKLGTDLITKQWPNAKYILQNQRRWNEMPVWHTATQGGLPIMGNPSMLLAYPPYWLIFFSPITWAFTLYFACHLVWAGWGTYTLSRRVWKVTPGAALLASLSFALSAKIVAHMGGGHLDVIGAVAWLPWLWWSVDDLVRRPRLTCLPVATTAVSIAAQALTHLPTLWLSGLAVGSWGVFMQLTEYKSDLPLQWARFAGKGLSALMLAAGLCAVHLWPMLELLPLSTRGGMNLSESIRYSLPPPLLIGLVLPTALAFPEWVIYLGLGTLNLAPASLLAFDQDREEMFVFALVVIGIAFSLGRATPLYALLFRFLPGMSWFRVPTRMMFLVQLGLALLTGVGWDTLRDLRPQRRRMLTSYSSALALAVSLGAVCSNIYLDVLDIPLLSSAIASAILIVLIGRSRIPRLRVRAYLLLGALMIMESKALALHFIAPAQSSSLSAATREIEFIGSRPGKFRTYSTHGTISLAEAVVYGVERADGKDPFQLKHYVKWLNTSSGCHLETYAISVPACAGNEVAREAYLRAQPNEVLLGIGNVQYVIADHSLESWEPSIWRFGDTRIYENPEVMPRGFVVPEVVVNDDNAAALALLEEMGPRTLATVPWMRDKPMYSDSSYSRARVIERSPNHAELQANGPGWLVWSEVWAPGWQASVDGHKTKVHRTNVAFCGLSLPEGPHVVRFDYKPSGWIWARRISLGAIIAVIVMIVASMQNRLHRGFRESVEKPTSRSIHR